MCASPSSAPTARSSAGAHAMEPDFRSARIITASPGRATASHRNRRRLLVQWAFDTLDLNRIQSRQTPATGHQSVLENSACAKARHVA